MADLSKEWASAEKIPLADEWEAAEPINTPVKHQPNEAKLKRQFMRKEMGLVDRIKNTSIPELAKNYALDAPRFAAEAVTMTGNAGLRGLKSIASTVQGGGEAIRTGDIDAGLRKYMTKQAEFQPMESPLEPSMAGELISTGVGKGVNALSEATGRPDIVEPVAQAAMDIAALAGVGRGMKGVTVSDLGKYVKAGAEKTIRPIVDNTQIPEKLYASAVKLPLSQKWRKTLNAEEVTKREDAINAGLAKQVMPDELGTAQARQLLTESAGKTAEAINEMDSMGNVIPKSALKPGLSKAQSVADVEGTATAQKIVNALYDKRFNKKGEMRPGDATDDPFGNQVTTPERLHPLQPRYL